MRYILSAKPGDHKSLFEFMESAEKLGEVKHVEMFCEKGRYKYRFRYYNGAPLNEKNDQVLVNFLEFWEEDTQIGKLKKKPGRKKHFSWVTDFEITDGKLIKLMRAGRARWRIENETFNTLKNQGYEFEHNFGHGKKNLSVVMATLMMLSFQIDQIQESCCAHFQAALARRGSRESFWEKMRSTFEIMIFESWSDFYGVMSERLTVVAHIANSS